MSDLRDALVRQQEHLRGLLRDCLVLTGQEGDNDGLAPGAFCRYCSEEIPLDRLLDSPVVWSEHAKTCTVFKMGDWIKEVDAVLGTVSRDADAALYWYDGEDGDA